MAKPKKSDAPEKGPILVPVDFSEPSVAALVWAAELAELVGGRLVVLHVVHDPFSAPGYYFGAASESVRKGVAKGRKGVRRLRKAAEGLVEEFVADVKARHPELAALQSAETILVGGLPVHRILEMAGREKVRTIVMGSQGRTGLAHLLLGSCAERVVRLAPIPVVIVKSGPTETEGD